jgi:hypothetical protein
MPSGSSLRCPSFSRQKVLVQAEPLLEIMPSPIRISPIEDQSFGRPEIVHDGTHRLVQLHRFQLVLDGVENRPSYVLERSIIPQVLEFIARFLDGGRQLRQTILRVPRDPFLPHLEAEVGVVVRLQLGSEFLLGLM